VVDEEKFQVVLRDAGRGQPEHTELAEHEAHAAGARQVALVLGEDAAHVGYGARWIVGGGFHQYGDPVRCVSFVQGLGVIRGVAAGGALDRRLHLVLGHVDGARVLDDASQ
jgi:hypothetical protein